VTTTAQPVTPQERALRYERADLVERDGMQVLIDYMHTGLYRPRLQVRYLNIRVHWLGGPWSNSPLA
jgi:hypothetical protein